jgi:hypothetical protein
MKYLRLVAVLPAVCCVLSCGARSDVASALDGNARGLPGSWAIAASSEGAVLPSGLAVDDTGRSTIVGRVQGTTHFGPFTIQGDGSRYFDAFLTTVDRDGRFAWATGIAAATSAHVNTGECTLRDVAVAAERTLVAAGYLDDAAATLGSTSLIGTKAFVAAFDAIGAFGAVTEIDQAKAFAVATDASGYTYVAGEVSGSEIGFAPFAASCPGHSRAGFVAKLTPKRTWAWVVPNCSPHSAASAGFPYGLSVDTDGSVYISCAFRAPVTLGDLHLQTSMLDPQVFVGKISPTGEPRWLVPVAAGESLPYSGVTSAGVRVDRAGNSYVGVSLSDIDERTSQPRFDGVVAKLNSNGEVVWTNRLGALLMDVAVTPMGESAVLVHRSAEATSRAAVAVVRLSPEGVLLSEYLGGTSRGKTEDIRGNRLAIDHLGNAYVVGTFREPVQFGHTELLPDQHHDGAGRPGTR